MVNIVVAIIIVVIIAGAILKLVNEKRKGNKCVGCPYSEKGNAYCSCNKNSRDVA
jgi:hypothetical protein